MLLHEVDDDVVAAEHDARFQAARPTTQLVDLAAGNRSDPAEDFMHGTVSDAGRGHYMAAVGAFADRAVAAGKAERRAARTHCSGVSRSIARRSRSALMRSLRCLARKDSRTRHMSSRGFRRKSISLRGELNAARIWSALRASKSGRRALAAVRSKRAKLTVRVADRSRVVLRVKR